MYLYDIQRQPARCGYYPMYIIAVLNTSVRMRGYGTKNAFLVADSEPVRKIFSILGTIKFFGTGIQRNTWRMIR